MLFGTLANTDQLKMWSESSLVCFDLIWLISKEHVSKRRILHCSRKTLMKNFNEQLEPDRPNIFPNGVMWVYYTVNILTT